MHSIQTQAIKPVRNVFIGCAGWDIPSTHRAHPALPRSGSQLERYAAVLSAVEINSSFYRPHLPETYARWRDTTPDSFRFSVKIPREITHFKKLVGTDHALSQFIGEVSQLADKLGCLLLQLPPMLAFDRSVAEDFFRLVSATTSARIVCEPRHRSWFADDASELMAAHDIARVIADPPLAGVEHVAPPKSDVVYLRLHGSPVIYRSAYIDVYLEQLAEWIALQSEVGLQVWCVFDNTASGAAFGNALQLQSNCSGFQGSEV